MQPNEMVRDGVTVAERGMKNEVTVFFAEESRNFTEADKTAFGGLRKRTAGEMRFMTFFA